jgi:chromosome segregation protein
VRLRDVTDLFLGTGVGTRAYSIIEQGRIGFVVNSKPEERRSLIEEVAGITKFKARKKSAERRMEATEQNLLRVNDVVSELDRQLGTLRKQAQKAERYKALRAELEDLELHIASMELLHGMVVEKACMQQVEDITQQLEDVQRGALADETGLEAARVLLMEEERALQVQQHVHAEQEASLAALERDVEHWKQQLSDMRVRGDSAVKEVEEAQQQIASFHAERVQYAEQLEGLEFSSHGTDAQLHTAKAFVVEMQDNLAALDEEIEVIRRHAYEHMQGAAKQRAVLEHLDKQRTDAMQREKQLREELETLEPRRVVSLEKHARLKESYALLLEKLQEAVVRKQDTEQALRGCVESLKTAQAAYAEQKEALSHKKSRLRSLQEIAQRMEGYSDGVRTLLAADSTFSGSFKGLVAEVFEVPSEYERAVEAVLGERLQYLLTHEEGTALAAIDCLRQTKGGRSGFVPLTLQGSDAVQMPAGVCKALDVVSYAPEHADVARCLLGHVVLVQNAQEALALRAKHPLVGCCYATSEGDVLDAFGVWSGGSAEGAGLLASQREIRELDTVVSGLEVSVASCLASCKQLEEQRQGFEQALSQCDQGVRALELDKVRMGKDVDAEALESQRMEERVGQVQKTLQEVLQVQERTVQQEHQALQAAERAEAGQQDTEWRLSELQERRQSQVSQLTVKQEALTSLKVQQASREEKMSSLRGTLTRLEHAENDLLKRIARGEQAIEQGRVGVAELLTKLEQGGAKASALSVHVGQGRLALDAKRAEYEARREDIGAVERQLKDQRRGTDVLQETLLQLKMDMQRVSIEMQRVVDTVFEKYDVDIRKICGTYHMRTIPGTAEYERKGAIERSIKAMGPINLTAIDECAQVETRFVFLSKQRDDLQEALDALRRAITRINKASRERFQQAFEAVNEMFQKVYPRLFRGGRARLELVGSDDLLEAGVDIVAEPPGKKLQNVGLLSGGEKALTATALVFSIFLIKPSPFCVLDEVDAPLDEANVGRFNEMLREISKISQFIVITHNKQTMLQADRLYGITMEEPGMSKVVAVDLERKEDTHAA